MPTAEGEKKGDQLTAYVKLIASKDIEAAEQASRAISLLCADEPAARDDAN